MIIVAAGTGTRMNSDIPKQFLPLHGKTVLRHTIETFLRCPGIRNIQVVINPDHHPLYDKVTKGLDILPPIYGGATRQASVFNALQSLPLEDHDIILVHDAARPCTSHNKICELVSALATHQAATLAAPITETIRLKQDNLYLGETLDRDQLLSMQTPQGFHFGILKSSHEKHRHENFTDDTAIVAADNIKVLTILSGKDNIKITTAEDLDMAEYILSKSYSEQQNHIIKTGSGFDVHAFGDPAPSIRIGGLDVPHTHRAEGHSDADVVLHAITDALFGTIADGDIGSHFPPHDPANKGKDSAYFLQEAQKAVTAKGGIINHIDTTIICEAPKIGPHREAMRNRIAEILDLPVSRISIKATTTEQLGFTGRREGIAAQSIATISIPETETK